MDDKARRKQLQADFKQARPEAVVYRIVNTRTNKALLGSTPNLRSLRGKLDFARATKTKLGGELGRRLDEDIRQFGIEAFALELVEALDVRPEMTQADILQDLETLEHLWRERHDPSMLY